MSQKPTSLSRRDALKWFAGTSAAGAIAPSIMAAPNETEQAPPAYPTRSALYDPNFAKPVYPWEKVLSPEELKTSTALADIILPKDANGPAASEVGVAEFINEWISAPIEKHEDESEIIRGGLSWLNTESFRRFEKRFEELTHEQQIQIADDICDASKAKPEHRIGAVFFQHFRKLSLSGYYTHSATWKGLGYVGNVSIAGPYPGVPDDLIKKLGLEDVA